MVSNWEEKFLDELCIKISAGGDKPNSFSKIKTDKLNIPVYANGIELDGLQGYTDKATITENAITISARGTIGFICKRLEPYCPIVRLISVIPKDDIYLDFLYYALHLMICNNSGSSIPQLTVPQLKKNKIKYPKNIDEQKRIAAKLDNAFQKIEALENNTKENIKNIEDLFKSYLNKVLNANDNYYKTTPFEECLDKVPNTTKINSKKFLKYGKYPIISQEKEFINGYWDNDADVFKVDTAVIIFGDHTKNIKYVDFDFIQGADGIKILKPKNFILPKYFFYYLNSLNLRNLGYARHYKLLKEHLIRYPEKIEEQKKIVDKLDIFNNKIQTIKQNYQNKLTLLDNLKNSILNKAFKGEL